MMSDNDKGDIEELVGDTGEKVDIAAKADDAGDKGSDNSQGDSEKESEGNDDSKKTDEKESEESVEDLQSRLQKVEEERDNYKEAVLISKKKEREITPREELSDDQKKELGDDGVKALNKKLSNEQSATKSFLDKHGDYVEDENWQELLTHYQAPENTTSANVEKALEAARVMHLHQSGELISKDEAEAQAREAITKAQVNNITAVTKDGRGGGSKQKNAGDNDSAKQMSKHFKHSSEEGIDSLDDSNSGVIDLKEI